jgi:hypothetical protein
MGGYLNQFPRLQGKLYLKKEKGTCIHVVNSPDVFFFSSFSCLRSGIKVLGQIPVRPFLRIFAEVRPARRANGLSQRPTVRRGNLSGRFNNQSRQTSPKKRRNGETGYLQ